MIHWDAVATLAGGIGLFLLGMTMMSDGLRLAAGPSLERILRGATRTPWHGLGSGVLVTSMVQSSSAVTVATIGFVNAGLLPLGGALWVLFGANVGTTMTGWIVALVGLKFKVEALAMPLVGIGVALQLSGAGKWRGALGGALAGFGLLFMGIALLQQAFGGLADKIDLPTGTGLLAVLTQMLMGVLMTVLMQSSSAAMTVVLAAAQGGLLTPEGAAAVVIGANIGTTTTALLATIGATANARRAAMAHVAFNVVAGVVALAMLPWLLATTRAAGAWLGLPPEPATQLALFHTCFNLLGVALMWPLVPSLSAWLATLFRGKEGDAGLPLYIDHTLTKVPALATQALARELNRLGHLAGELLRLAADRAPEDRVRRAHADFVSLDTAILQFVQTLSRQTMSEASSAALAHGLRVRGYHQTSAELAMAAYAVAVPEPGVGPDGGPTRSGTGTGQALLSAFVQAVLGVLDASDPLRHQAPLDPSGAIELEHLVQAQDTLAVVHNELKAHWLSEAAQGHLALDVLDARLHRAAALRDAAVHMAKASRWAWMQHATDPSPV